MWHLIPWHWLGHFHLNLPIFREANAELLNFVCYRFLCFKQWTLCIPEFTFSINYTAAYDDQSHDKLIGPLNGTISAKNSRRHFSAIIDRLACAHKKYYLTIRAQIVPIANISNSDSGLKPEVSYSQRLSKCQTMPQKRRSVHSTWTMNPIRFISIGSHCHLRSILLGGYNTLSTNWVIHHIRSTTCGQWIWQFTKIRLKKIWYFHFEAKMMKEYRNRRVSWMCQRCRGDDRNHLVLN